MVYKLRAFLLFTFHFVKETHGVFSGQNLNCFSYNKSITLLAVRKQWMIFTPPFCGLVNNLSYSPPLRWINVNYHLYTSGLRHCGSCCFCQSAIKTITRSTWRDARSVGAWNSLTIQSSLQTRTLKLKILTKRRGASGNDIYFHSTKETLVQFGKIQ